ncbi:MAG TPA: replication-associated recombination protein A [Candidatus Ornithomonoglobus merdipullorum]|uniref:Replication-associated recombination protein A n=1 Tax=Candidatus Ornithomonoglobus merdipullorum TaxID=2840895 RepID=A0A9D1MDK6_9FIRM|nr:replication-associated recombination protein A [Candidatus Ornithomonoglobus merdipullorum]
MNMKPLADRLRPASIDDVVGQQHLLGKGKLLRRIIENNEIPNMIFYGPSGVGKTTVANIIAARTGKTLHRLNATTASVSDIKNIAATLDTFLAPDGVLLYLDEIQHFNKKQQQSLLEFMENGKITLIASTTENPYFYVYNAVLSRSIVFEFKPVPPSEIERALERAASALADEMHISDKLRIEPDAVRHLAESSNGDVRKALNSLEAVFLALAPGDEPVIDLDAAEQAAQKKAIRYDKDGDSHYDILSAFQKSIRGSDPDAAVHYLARLVSAGDIQSICRRLLVMASEDVGLAYPMAAVIVKACVDSALQLGFPEARIPLAEAAILLATAPKSNSAISAIGAAMRDIETIDTGDVPVHLKDSHYSGSAKLGHGTDYVNPHSMPNHYIKQQYLPDNIKDRVYYEFGNNKTELAAREYQKRLRGSANNGKDS